jgi:hypothetical protein
MADTVDQTAFMAPPVEKKQNMIWTVLFVIFAVLSVLYIVYLFRMLTAPKLRYTSSNSFTVDVAITSLTPTTTNFTATHFAVSPALPTGLSLNSSTGAITGTPTVLQASLPYTVLASSTTQSACYKFNIAVVAA